MVIGPVQLVVLGFNQPEFRGEILAEFDRLKDNDVVRVIDGLAVYKDAEGEVTGIKTTGLGSKDAVEFGAVVGALIGLGAAGLEGAKAGAEAGAAAAEEGVDILDDEDVWDVIDDIPNDSAAAVILLEHRWAIPLRDAIRQAGGFPIADGFVHPEDLVAIGLLAAEEAEALMEPEGKSA